ncbi:extracellular catalytic domain type 1 short-chain-length polyhydroxyalkanoate depolymerase [Actinomycetospora flava]|uniref:PHB depolymerase family esterase n=1 Tax=Actinomycetospora flava TaxID=3129232 RepID=A0ABU8MD77_9PSEU
MTEATRLVREGRLLDATARIQERLGGGVPGTSSAASSPGSRAGGTVTRGSAAGLAYRLHVPRGLPAGAPLLVMLHGGTQDADGFAACTGMDAAAERAGVAVVYPEQSRSANAMGYWNWFRPGDQARDAGEPAMIAAITRTVAAQLRTDPARVAVAGFSAGAAMAAVMAAAYPDLYCGAGVHSGLPYRAAGDVASAFAAMSSPPGAVADAGPVPLVVVHGDADRTVAPGNGEAVLRSALVGAEPGRLDRTTGRAPGGRDWTRERFSEPGGRVLAESWTVHGLGHAWSGGPGGVQYADPSGPDASTAMLAFFGFTADRVGVHPGAAVG